MIYRNNARKMAQELANEERRPYVVGTRDHGLNRSWFFRPFKPGDGSQTRMQQLCDGEIKEIVNPEEAR